MAATALPWRVPYVELWTRAGDLLLLEISPLIEHSRCSLAASPHRDRLRDAAALAGIAAPRLRRGSAWRWHSSALRAFGSRDQHWLPCRRARRGRPGGGPRGGRCAPPVQAPIQGVVDVLPLLGLRASAPLSGPSGAAALCFLGAVVGLAPGVERCGRIHKHALIRPLRLRAPGPATCSAWLRCEDPPGGTASHRADAPRIVPAFCCCGTLRGASLRRSFEAQQGRLGEGGVAAVLMVLPGRPGGASRVYHRGGCGPLCTATTASTTLSTQGGLVGTDRRRAL
mmetsp:Transcript_34200/g.74488  ORF Transcript_34200/g.74488 Transcript_34200/m.74488 type:complete len:283 (+) Transcript_34200:360-1208(+)